MLFKEYSSVNIFLRVVMHKIKNANKATVKGVELGTSEKLIKEHE